MKTLKKITEAILVTFNWVIVFNIAKDINLLIYGG